MARRAYVRFQDDPEGALEVAIADNRGIRTLDEGVAGLKPGDDVIVFVPGTEVGWVSAALPARNEREARRAALFSIEDDLASPTEGLHVSVSPKDAEGARVLLTCETVLMERWTERLKAEEIAPLRIAPEFAVLPSQDCAVDLGNRILVKIGGRPMALDGDGPFDLLQAVLATAESDVSVYGRDLSHRLGRPEAATLEGSPVSMLATLEGRHGSGQDLRQGIFASREPLTLPEIGAWRRPLLVAAGAGAVWLGATAWESASLVEESRVMRAEASAIYAAAFADEGAVSDPAARIQSKLAQGAGAALDFERTAAIVYQSLEQLEGAQLRTLRYDRAAGEVRVSIDYGGYGDDLRFAEALTSTGLSANLGDTRTSGAAITGDVTIRAIR